MKIQELEDLIRSCNDSYRRGEPQIPDADYDKLVETLFQRDPNNPWFSGLGDKVEGTRKSELPIPMYSLEKVKTRDEVCKWVKSCGLAPADLLIITAKYDGISLCVDEHTGMAWTRGNGIEGLSSPDHYSQLMGTPHPVKKFRHTFGEAIFPIEEFEKIKAEGRYKSARNCIAGLFNSPQTDPLLHKARYMRYGTDDDTMDKDVQLNILSEYGRSDKAVKHYAIPAGELVEMDETMFRLRMDSLFDEVLPDGFKCDGLVIEVNKASIRKRLGRLNNGNPRYAIAYKDPAWAERAATTIRDVKWKISKDGKAAPVGILDPVDLCGATVSQCTLYNGRYVEDMRCVKGAVIVICRSGDVIPKHLTTISHPPYERALPEICPSCGNPLYWDNSRTNVICTDEDCPGRKMSLLTYFFSTLGIENMGEPTIQKFFDMGIETPHTLMSLEVEDMVLVDGIGRDTAETLYRQFEDILENGVPFARMTTALNCWKGVFGEKTCQTIVNGLGIKCHEDMDRIFDRALHDTRSLYTRLIAIAGVGMVTAWQFIDGLKVFYESEHFTFWNVSSYSQEKGDGPSFVFSGFRDADLAARAVAAGFREESNLTKKTGYLVLKDDKSTSSKAEKARKYGVETISIARFVELIDGNKE